MAICVFLVLLFAGSLGGAVVAQGLTWLWPPQAMGVFLICRVMGRRRRNQA